MEAAWKLQEGKLPLTKMLCVDYTMSFLF